MELQFSPRLCAHRGYHTHAPENSLPALEAAVCLGAQEIEFDLHLTADAQPVSIHDSRLERISNGTGLVSDHTLAQLQKLDFGSWFHKDFTGLPVLTFGDILEHFAGRCILNIHLKPVEEEMDPKALETIADAVYAAGCQKQMYFMSTDPVLRQLRQIAPDLPRYCGSWIYPEKIVARAQALECTGIQLTKPKFTPETVLSAHRAGLRCNVFWSDDPAEAADFLNMGIDTVLTNDYGPMVRSLKERGFPVC